MFVDKPSVITACVILASAASTAVALRFYVRRTRQLGIGLDDWLILLALVYPHNE